MAGPIYINSASVVSTNVARWRFFEDDSSTPITGILGVAFANALTLPGLSYVATVGGGVGYDYLDIRYNGPVAGKVYDYSAGAATTITGSYGIGVVDICGGTVADYLRYFKATSPTTLSGITQYSMSFWLKVKSIAFNGSNTIGYLFSRTNFTISVQSIAFTDSNYSLSITDTGGTWNTEVTLPVDTWINVVITASSSSNLQFYVNGIKQTKTVSSSFSGTLGSGDLYILTENSEKAALADADISDIGIWNRVLTPTEIEQLSLRAYSPALIPNGLRVAWPILGGISTEQDATSFNNDLLVFPLIPSVYTSNSYDGTLDELPLTLLSPHVAGPSAGEMFNRGKVTISWNQSDPPSLDVHSDTSFVTYEIEYTDNYDGSNTVWRTLKRRIPWEDTSYVWNVGKMVKSKNVRIRIRAKDLGTEAVSEWAENNGDFSINVFDLIPPSIVSPIPNRIYSDAILIVLDETPIKNTFNQKVRYTLEYTSEQLGIDWTIIAANVPVGQNVIRWNISGLTPSDDYVLRVTARNKSTCQDATETTPDQIAKQFVYDLRIQQTGMFLIDTIPPRARIDIEGNINGVTNNLDQVISIYADDATTDVETVRLRDCNANNLLPLGNVNNISNQDNCSLNSLLFAKEIPYTSKVHFTLDGSQSGFKKLEALVSDSGGNLSFQEPARVFLPFFRPVSKINDFLLVTEIRDEVDFTVASNGAPSVVLTPATFELIYAGLENGELWALDPFPRMLYDIGRSIKKIVQFNGLIYIGTYETVSEEGVLTDLGAVYLHDGTSATLISPEKTLSNPTDHFQKTLAVITAMQPFGDSLYVGFANGELWEYDSNAWSKIHAFDRGINFMSSDDHFLYIGLQNSSSMALYNGISVYSVSMSF